MCLLIVSCNEKRTNRSLVSKPNPSNNELKTNKKKEDKNSSTVMDVTNDVMLLPMYKNSITCPVCRHYMSLIMS